MCLMERGIRLVKRLELHIKSGKKVKKKKTHPVPVWYLLRLVRTFVMRHLFVSFVSLETVTFNLSVQKKTQVFFTFAKLVDEKR